MTNISEILGTNGIKLRCSYTKDSNDRVSGVTFLTVNDSDIFVKIAEATIFSIQPELLPYGVYLFGSANITKFSDSPSEFVLTFNNLICKHERNYICRLAVQDTLPTYSAPMQLFVQIPPSKPENVVMIRTPVDVSTTTAKANDRTSISSDNEKVTSGIMDGDNITVKCSGNVGKPAGIFTFKVQRKDNIQPTTYDATTTEIERIPGNCSYYRTSYLPFQVTAEDNQAVIRCVVLSPLAGQDMFIDSEQLEVKYNVRMPTVTKHPAKQEYIVGVDTSITLTCTTDGNPKPIYRWFEGNQSDIISTDDNFTLTDINTTKRCLYICYVTNTFNGHTYTKAAQMEFNIINEENEAKSTTSRITCSNETPNDKELKNGNTAVIVVGTVCGSIILVLTVILFAVIHNKKKTSICPCCHDRSEVYVNTTHQQNASLYEGVDNALDVHDYGQLSSREHEYTNTNFTSS
ncbi:unnamed protein product [Mytilus coruscus]|uniref:Ig-like domain-containing protein n=1 Tax=Mytilus coruscus TaxID=42192 RepID=A0A6J8DHZ4_MYTCO|nr:unnamed protein product [Mytilus coruscus]